MDLSGSSRDVRILVNDDPEALSWEEPDSLRVEGVSPDRVHMQLRQTGATAAPSAAGGPLMLRVPPRFCSIDVTSGGGNVHVQAVKEGSLTVESRGGDIHIGSMAGATAELLSGGGAVTGSVTAEKVFVHTDPGTGGGSGNVRLDKLLAKEAVILARDLDTSSPLAVRSQDGAAWGSVHVTALYAEEAHIKSGGSPVSIGTLSCSADGVIISGGGPVSVAGLDGSLRVISGGGAVELQLQKNVQDVHVNSNADPSLGGAASAGGSQATESAAAAGAISCRIDPAVSAVLATCCENLNVDTALPFEALSVKGHVITAHVGPEPAQQSPPQLDGAAGDAIGKAPPPKHIVLDAGERGRIEVGARSWADSIKERFSNGGGSGGRKSMAQASAAAWVPPS